MLISITSLSSIWLDEKGGFDWYRDNVGLGTLCHVLREVHWANTIRARLLIRTEKNLYEFNTLYESQC